MPLPSPVRSLCLLASRYLYLLLEICPGGELYEHQQKRPGKKFDEITAAFYAGCITEGLKVMHQYV